MEYESWKSGNEEFGIRMKDRRVGMENLVWYGKVAGFDYVRNFHSNSCEEFSRK